MRLPGFGKRRRPADEEVVAGSNSHPSVLDGQGWGNENNNGNRPVNSGNALRPAAARADSANSHTSYPPNGQPKTTAPDELPYDLWGPFFLRKIFLFALVVLFIAIGIALGIIFSQSKKYNGFSTAKEEYYYLWTYGPTAVFTSIAALWAQVEYRSKQLMPWSALQRAPQRCETSLLLDYVDPMNVVSLFHSFRKSHLFVTVAIAGAFLVQLMVVLSSGLFEAVSVTIVYNNDASLKASEAFVGEYNNTITSRPANIFYGKMLYNLSYPLGTTQDYAYQLFNTSHSSVENTSAIVDVFSADLDCDNATVLKVTPGFYTGMTENPLFDGISFTVSVDSDAKDVWLEASSESNCSDMIVKVKNNQAWNYNGSYCPEQPDGPDRNRLVIVSGSWETKIMSTLTVDEWTTTSTAGLIPASLLVGDSTTTRTTSRTEVSASARSSRTSSISSAAASTRSLTNDVSIQIEPRPTTSPTKDVWIQVEPRPTTSSSGNDIQLDDPPSDLTLGVNVKRAESSTATSKSTSATIPYFVLPTKGYTPAYAISCKPRYSIRKANVTLSKTASSADINTNAASNSHGFAFANMMLLEGDAAEERQLDDFAAWTIMSPVFTSIELSDSELMSGGLMAFINIMAPEVKPGEQETDRIIDGLRQTYRSVSAQVANTYLTRAFAGQQDANTTDLENQNRTLTGRTITRETRLAMQAPAFWVTEMALLVAVFGTSFLLLSSSDMRMSRDPGTIGGLATILARSEATTRLLDGTGALPLKKMKEVIGTEKQFAAGVVQASSGSSTWCEFLIETDDEAEQRRQAGSLHNGESGATQQSEVSGEPSEWYRPFAVSLLGRLLIVSVPLALIVALEVLYQYSADHDGLADVDDSNRYVHYAWTFIPTLMMVAVGQLFGMLDFATKVFAPYSALYRVGGASVRTSIMDNYLDKLGVHVLFAALSRKQWAVAAVAVATVLSPLLTIVTSGLLNAEIAPANYTVAITQLDNFTSSNISWAQGNNEGIPATNLVFANNLTYPQWTYDTLAIPRFELAATQSSSSVETVAKNATTLRATVPAVRGVANCTVRPASWFHACNSDWVREVMSGVGADFGPEAQSKFSGNGYFGRWMAPWTVYDTDESEACPPIVSTFGRVEDGTVAEATHLACHPYVERVDANVTLALPDYRIDIEDHPPEAPPIGAAGGSESAVFSHEFWHFATGGYKLTNPNPRNDTDEDLSTLYGLVVWGPDGVPKEELMRDENKLISRVEKVYAQILAQVMNEKREWANGTTEKTKRDAEESAGLTGTILYTGRTRLKQSPVSTRILEGLFATMFVCAALAAALLDTNRVLPKNPCSIAAVASLLAGSELLASIPQGAEWMSDKQLKEKGVFEGKVYSIGWWDRSVDNRDGSRSSSGGKRFGIDFGTAITERGQGRDNGSGDSAKVRWRPAWLRGSAK